MSDLDRLIKDALGGIQGKQPNPYMDIAEHLAMMHNAFVTVGFTHDEAYEVASNILLEQLSQITGKK